MQIKTIEKITKAKINEWLDTISDIELRKEVKSNLLVTGGCFASMLLSEPVNDYDVYITNMSTCNKLTLYYCKSYPEITVLNGSYKEDLIAEYNKKLEKYKSENKDLEAIDFNNSFSIALRNLKEDQIKLYFSGAGQSMNTKLDKEDQNYVPLFFSPNAISLSKNVQIVLRFVGDANHIHKNFDFIHATNYFTFEEGFVRNLPAMESLITKQLKYQGSYYPVTSIIRAKKFTKRGFNISAGELLKIMFQISELNLSDPDVLEEQLVGVDIAYFSTLIDILRRKVKDGIDFKLTSEYLNNIIDKVFNEDND